MKYDQQIAHIDALFGKVIAGLEANGILENSYVIATSDHGEMFERGFFGHSGPLLYEPAIRIPLLIHAPGQNARQDVYAPTSNIDVLPTLLSFADKAVPSNLDGSLLARVWRARKSGAPALFNERDRELGLLAADQGCHFDEQREI